MNKFTGGDLDLPYILMVSRLLNNISETLIAFQENWAETALLLKDFICPSTLSMPFS